MASVDSQNFVYKRYCPSRRR